VVAIRKRQGSTGRMTFRCYSDSSASRYRVTGRVILAVRYQGGSSGQEPMKGLVEINIEI